MLLKRSSFAAFALIVVQMLSTSPALAQSSACSAMSVGRLSRLNGFVPFAPGSPWNSDISGAAVDSNSANIVNFIGNAVTLHPDFGAGKFAGQSIGIPYQVVAGSQRKGNVKLGAFGDESHPGPMPLPSMALVEGYT